MWVLVCSKAVESKLVKLNRDQPYSDTSPNGECYPLTDWKSTNVRLALFCTVSEKSNLWEVQVMYEVSWLATRVWMRRLERRGNFLRPSAITRSAQTTSTCSAVAFGRLADWKRRERKKKRFQTECDDWPGRLTLVWVSRNFGRRGLKRLTPFDLLRKNEENESECWKMSQQRLQPSLHLSLFKALTLTNWLK